MLIKTAFLLGNLAPDASTAKQSTHYYAGRHEDLTRRLDIEQYWTDSAEADHSYRLGYYCHLVADEIWLQGFYKGWLKQVITKNPAKQAMYYADFDAYNARLAQRLDLFDFESLRDHATDELRELVAKVEREAQATVEGTYTIFFPHQLDGYVDTCILRCRDMVRQKHEVIG
ncbi:zinc dependent phospholipase C family protein [Bacillus sp. P14.5]|uniref:zinc dependent phospholipase C family protein n=1 Tax=Bacillus sp. P14.5 TaxID=1983400 RepID=UPI0013B04CC7|nr:zinc dependent phospholipase C family protein [Bacillus sp. P14.5]